MNRHQKVHEADRSRGRSLAKVSGSFNSAQFENLAPLTRAEVPSTIAMQTITARPRVLPATATARLAAARRAPSRAVFVAAARGDPAGGEPEDAARKAAGYAGEPNERESGKAPQPRGVEPPQGDGEGEEYSMADLAKRGGDSESASESADVQDIE